MISGQSLEIVVRRDDKHVILDFYQWQEKHIEFRNQAALLFLLHDDVNGLGWSLIRGPCDVSEC